MGCTGYLVGLHRLSGGLHRLSGWVAQAIWWKTDNSAQAPLAWIELGNIFKISKKNKEKLSEI